MHIGKINCDNILHTIMIVFGKTKDNEKARLDLTLYYKETRNGATTSSKLKISKTQGFL
jgi:hypothetical protein